MTAGGSELELRSESMSDKTLNNDGVTSRRDFMRNMLVGSSAVAVAAFAGGARAAEEAATPEAAPSTERPGYHVTPHVLEYYKTAGL
jgi:hypothetical protein